MEVNSPRQTDRLRSQSGQLKQLNALFQEMVSLSNEAELLQAGLRGLVGLIGADHAAVMLMEADRQSGRVVSEFPSHGAVGQRHDLSSNPFANALASDHRAVVLVSDLQNDPRLTPPLRELMKGLGIEAMLVLPLMVHGQLIGTIGLDIYRREHPFTEDMITLAQTIAVQISISVQNIRLQMETEERVSQLQQVTTIGQSVHASLQLDAILNAMLTETPRLFPVDHMIIALFDATSNQLKVVAQNEARRIMVDVTHAPLVPLGTTLIGDVWQSGQPVRINDTAQAGMRLRLQDARVRSVMAAPIALREQKLGVTYVGSLRASAYTETDAALLQQINNQLAAAIENSTALSETQRAARAQMLINTITAHIQQRTDLEEMLTAAAHELGRALGARRVRAALTANDE